MAQREVNVISKGNSFVVLRQGRVKVHRRRLFNADARVQSQVGQSGVYVGQRGTGTGSSPRKSVFHFSLPVFHISPSILREMKNSPIKDGKNIVSLHHKNK
jgi:hypothetical protein